MLHNPNAGIPASETPLTVGQLTRSVKQLLENAYPFVWVRGQVSNVSRPSSGHIYFSLKDDEALVPAVWFRGNQREAETFDPLTGEVYEDGPKPSLAAVLANGQEVIAAGRLSVYPPRGAYQIIVELVQDAGLGRLHQEFERIKAALAAEGLFSQERKRRLPVNPSRVAVVTAPGGAAIHDFCRLAAERGTLTAELRIYPAPVQGEGAPEKIAAALALACADGWAEVICLIRGGGSLEDLWAFNTETVARAVFASGLPVLAGIGHEVDVSIADLVADVRAATPSHAAQLLWREKGELIQRADEAETRLKAAFARYLAPRDSALSRLEASLALLSPTRLLQRRKEQLTMAAHRLDRAMHAVFAPRRMRLDSLQDRLGRASQTALHGLSAKLDRLEAGFAALHPANRLSRMENRLDSLCHRLEQAGQEITRHPTARLKSFETRAELAAGRRLADRERRLENLEIRLRGLDPYLPLQRGYAMVSAPDGSLLRSVDQAGPGDLITLKIRDGRLAAMVTNTEKSLPGNGQGKDVP